MSRSDPASARVHEQALPQLDAGEVLFAVERFSLTANNITYGPLLGERLGYWKLFPTTEGWGRIPVWGYLRALESRSPAVKPGSRAYGFCPPGSHVVLRPQGVSRAGFVDAADRRRALDPVYSTYSWLEADPAHDETLEDELLVLRPVFWLSLMLEDHLLERGVIERARVLITSASSKVGIGTAHLLARRGADTVGLTAASNVGFVRDLGLYGQVVAYEDSAGLDCSDSVLLDVAGSAATRRSLRDHLGGCLLETVIAGGTHFDASGVDTEPEAEDVVFLFAPTRIRERAGQLGWTELNRRYCSALGSFANDAQRWLEIRRASDGDGVLAGYEATLRNETPPAVALVLGLGPAQGEAGSDATADSAAGLSAAGWRP